MGSRALGAERAGRWLALERCLALALLLAGLLGAGCATRGTRFDPDLVPRIERGVTTRAEIRRWFGTPLSERVWGSGGTRWRYLYEERARGDTGTAGRIVRWVAALFGLRTYPAPVSVSYESTTRHELEVDFDRRGVVRDYSYARERVPRRSVY